MTAMTAQARGDPCGNLLAPLPEENKPDKARTEILEMSSAERKRLTVAVLRAELKKLGLNTRGKKAALLARIAEAARNRNCQKRKRGANLSTVSANEELAANGVVVESALGDRADDTGLQEDRANDEEMGAEVDREGNNGDATKRCLTEQPQVKSLPIKERGDGLNEVMTEAEYESWRLRQNKRGHQATDGIASSNVRAVARCLLSNRSAA